MFGPRRHRLFRAGEVHVGGDDVRSHLWRAGETDVSRKRAADKFIFDAKDIDKIVSRGTYTTTVLFSKKIQKEYSNRDEITLIISEADERASQRIQRGNKIFNVTYYCIIPLGLFFAIIFDDSP